MFLKQARFHPVVTLGLVAALLIFGGAFLPHHSPVAAEPSLDVNAQSAGVLTYGSGVGGSVNPPSSVATYSFNGTAGDLVDIQVVGLSPSMSPSIALLDSTQNRLEINNNDVFSPISGDASLSYFLPYTGLYLIVVTDTNGGASNFMLRLDGRPAIVSPMLEPNIPVRVDMPANSGPQFFRFEQQSQCFSTLTIIPETPEFGFTAHIRTEVGPSVAVLRGGALRENRLTVPPDSGIYEVEIGVVSPELEGYVILVLTCAEDAPFCESAADFGPVDLILPGGRLDGTPTPMSTPPGNTTPPPGTTVTPTLPPPPDTTPTPTLPPPPGPSRTPTVPPPDDCSAFQITSPTDGLPNGPVTIYWDPVPGAAGYIVNVINLDNAMTTGASVGPGVTNVTLDVGVGVLGPGFNFRIVVAAIDAFQERICVDEVNLLRESPEIPGIPDDDPDDEPDPFCGDNMCNGRETANSCPADCPFGDAPGASGP